MQGTNDVGAKDETMIGECVQEKAATASTKNAQSEEPSVSLAARNESSGSQSTKQSGDREGANQVLELSQLEASNSGDDGQVERRQRDPTVAQQIQLLRSDGKLSVLVAGRQSTVRCSRERGV